MLIPSHDTDRVIERQPPSLVGDPWTTEVMPRLPANLAKQARALNALQRARGLATPHDLLRGILASVLEPMSTRQWGAWAVLIDLADISETAWRQRLRARNPWLLWFLSELVVVEDGTQTLKDAINAALRDWSESMDTTHYVMGTVCGPHPFPQMVTYFQSIIGHEAREQMLQAAHTLPTRVYACVGGGSNASGIFAGFLDDPQVELIGVEAGGLGFDTGQHAARLAQHVGRPGVAQGYKTCFLQNAEGQMQPTHSVAAGLDYIGVGPILAYLHQIGRIRVEAATDAEVLETLQLVIRREGIIPALESAHAFVTALKEAPQLSPDEVILINQSGRGDKDIFTIAEALGDARWRAFLRDKVATWDREGARS